MPSVRGVHERPAYAAREARRAIRGSGRDGGKDRVRVGVLAPMKSELRAW
jgi:hypothetical protein